MSRIVHFEVSAEDPERAAAFYKEALGWDDRRGWRCGVAKDGRARSRVASLLPRHRGERLRDDGIGRVRLVTGVFHGDETGGGYSRSDVIISSRPVDYPQLLGIDLLVALSDEAAHRYAALLRPEGVFLFDSDEVRDPPLVPGPTYGISFTRLAFEVTGRAQTANILTLGAVVGLTGVVSAACLEQSVLGMVPPGTEELNLASRRARARAFWGGVAARVGAAGASGGTGTSSSARCPTRAVSGTA